MGDDAEGDGDAGEEEDKNGNKVSKKKPKYSKEEMKKIKDEIKEGMISAAQAAGAGNTPAEVATYDKRTYRT